MSEACDYNTKGAYHGAHSADEVAALISLMCGARLKAGGWTRWFQKDGDPLGQPMGFDGAIHWQVDIRNLVLPRTVRTLNNFVALHSTEFSERFQSYAELLPEDAAALVKAARLYQDALWVAESEPHIAWLFLVSAVETAASRWNSEEIPAATHLRDVRPRLVKMLQEHGGQDLVDLVAAELASVTGATRRFREFVLTFDPGPPPSGRLHPVDWRKLKRALNQVYDWRSRALHGGSPFPSPMCSAPLLKVADGVPSFGNLHRARITERPIGLAAGTGDAMWENDETPMLLHVFEHIARGALLKWWTSLPRCSDPGRASDS